MENLDRIFSEGPGTYHGSYRERIQKGQGSIFLRSPGQGFIQSANRRRRKITVHADIAMSILKNHGSAGNILANLSLAVPLKKET